MIGKMIAVGTGPGSLVSYLFGPGRFNEHSEQRLIAGSAMIEAGFGGVDLAHDSRARNALGQEFDEAWRQVRRERGLSLVPAEGEKARGAARPDRVFHVVLSLGEREGALSDEKWGQLAREFVQQMDFVDSQNGADCAWFAVHHGHSKDGNDHLHIAVNLVRDDGRRWDDKQSKRRTAQAAARIAAKHSLEVVFDSGVSSGVGNVPRAELERARREEREPDRVLIRRRLAGAAWQASSEAEYVRAARASGVLVRPRYAPGGIVQVEGYSVAMADSGKAVWFAPSKLDRSLGLPVLRERYGWTSEQQFDAIPVWRERSGAERKGIGGLRLPVEDEIRKVRVTLAQENTEVRWRRAAHDTSAFLGAWSVRAEGRSGGPLGDASDALARAAQPRRRTAREQLIEGVQTVVSVGAAAQKNSTAASLAVLMEVMRLAESTARAADAARDAREARAIYEKAVLPLNIEAGATRRDRVAEQMGALDAEEREALVVAGGLRPDGTVRAHSGKPDPKLMTPETRAALGYTGGSGTIQAESSSPSGAPRGPEWTQSQDHEHDNER